TRRVRREACRAFRDRLHETMDAEGIPRDLPVFAAGFMTVLPPDFVDGFFIVNVHPGDLTKYTLQDGLLRGERSLVGGGWRPAAKAISAGHDTLTSSLHLMTPELDAGPVFMRGYRLPVDYNRLLAAVDIEDRDTLREVATAAQQTLKHIGDHVVAGATFHDLFQGNWGRHGSGSLAYRAGDDWYLAPNGIDIHDHVANNPDSPFALDGASIQEHIDEFYAAVDRIGDR
ncbi:MAG: hypothetical protein ABEK12_03810, partial [Candidatus Nanohaloarchaea archaeon]